MEDLVAAHPSSDPVERWMETAAADMFGPAAKGSGSSSNRERNAHPFIPVTPVPVMGAALGAESDRIGAWVTSLPDPAVTTHVLSVLDQLSAWQGVLVAAGAAAVVVDGIRWCAHRHRRALDNQVYSTTLIRPKSIRIVGTPGVAAPRRAVVRLPAGSVVTDKRHDALTDALNKSANRLFSTPLIARVARLTEWQMDASWVAGRNRIVVTRHPVTAAEVHSVHRTRLDIALRERFPLAGAHVVTPAAGERDTYIDENGVEIGYRISYTPNINAARPAFQQQVRDALSAFLPAHESGSMWTVAVLPEKDTIEIGLAAPLPTRVPHRPLTDYSGLPEKELHRVPYATGAEGVVAVWNIGWSSNAPHFLASGPTGAGKTSTIRTLVTEAILRGLPVLGIDPKMIELDGMEGYPGVACVVYNIREIVALINAVHAEMMARREHVHRTKIPNTDLPLFVLVMDEFFVMSGLLTRAMKYSGSDPEQTTLQEFVKDSDPLGKIAEILALIRSLGGRIIQGVQQPSAKNYGDDGTSVRDNFGTRASHSNVSPQGAQMMWGDTQVGRDLDTSIPGRATVTGPTGQPMTAQAWWTPDVDDHPNKWARLSEDDRGIVTALRPETAPEFVAFSAEMREFLDAHSGKPAAAPTPVAGIDLDQVEDGIRADELRKGDRIYIDEDGQTFTAIVTKVTKTKTGIRAELTDPDNSRITHRAEFDNDHIVLTDSV